MATTVKSNSNTFVNILSAQFESGKTDFEDMSGFFLRSIKELEDQKEQWANNAGTAVKNPTVIKNIQEGIAIDKAILHTAINAQKDYLNNTFLGKIEKLFQCIFSAFGIKSSLERAEERINALGGFEIPEVEITSKAQAEMARFIAFNENETLYFPLGDNKANPSTILIAKPDGDVYEIPRERFNAQGTTRFYYEGKLHGIDEVKTVGILSNLPTNKSYPYKEAQLSEIIPEMKKEYSVLQKHKDIERVIRAYDYFAIPVSGVDAGFTIMEHNEMDLLQFITPTPGGDTRPDRKRANNLSLAEKKNFMLSLLDTFQQLHNKNQIHRDVKTKNIVVRKNEENQHVPTVIDLTTCISDDNVIEKQETVSTFQWWPPEYVNAFLSGNKSDIERATTKSMDTWGLGLVFFHFFYGEDLIDETLGFRYAFGNDIHKAQFLQKGLKENFPAFLEAIQSGTLPEEKEESWKEICTKVKQNPLIWNQIILPMLSIDPDARPSMGDLYRKLQNIIPQ